MHGKAREIRVTETGALPISQKEMGDVETAWDYLYI